MYSFQTPFSAKDDISARMDTYTRFDEVYIIDVGADYPTGRNMKMALETGLLHGE